jgi:hypothetical protein
MEHVHACAQDVNSGHIRAQTTDMHMLNRFFSRRLRLPD